VSKSVIWRRWQLLRLCTGTEVVKLDAETQTQGSSQKTKKLNSQARQLGKAVCSVTLCRGQGVCSWVGILNAVYNAVFKRLKCWCCLVCVRSVLIVSKRLPDTVCCAAPCSVHWRLSSCSVDGAPVYVYSARYQTVCLQEICSSLQYKPVWTTPWSIVLLGKQKSLIREYLGSDRRRRIMTVLTSAVAGPCPQPLMT
jgi:hypothetical protein